MAKLQPSVQPKLVVTRFGFNRFAEQLNGRAAMMGFALLLLIEYVTAQNPVSGKGQNNTTPAVVTNVDPKTAFLQGEVFKVIVAPNPSTTNFKIRVESSSHTQITIRVIDAAGRVLATMTGVQNNQLVTLGGNYIGGSYFAEVIQGNNHKTVKLIKL